MSYTIKVSMQMRQVVGSLEEDEFPAPDNWESMSPKEQQEYLDGCVEDHVGNHVVSWSDVIEDDPDDFPGE